MDRSGRLAKYGYWALGTVIFGLCTLVFGFGLGFNVGGGPPEKVVEVRYKTAPAPKTIKSTSLPIDCTLAVEELEIVYREAGIIATMADRQVDLMSNAQVAMLEREFQTLNKLTSEQRTRNEKTDNAVTALVEAQVRFVRAISACKRQLKESE